MQVHRRRLRECDAGVPTHSLINPGPQHPDLFRSQLRPLHWHDVIGVKAGNELDEMAFRALTRSGDRAIVAALENRLARVELETALILAAPVAFDTTGLEDGLDVAGEIDRAGGGRRQLLKLLRREFPFGAQTDGEQQNRRPENGFNHDSNYAMEPPGIQSLLTGCRLPAGGWARSRRTVIGDLFCRQDPGSTLSLRRLHFLIAEH